MFLLISAVFVLASSDSPIIPLDGLVVEHASGIGVNVLSTGTNGVQVVQAGMDGVQVQAAGRDLN